MTTLPNWSSASEENAAPWLDAYAGAYSLPRAIVYGLVALESQFNPNAYRAEPQINDASRGLTQILFRTAQGMGYSGTPDGLYDVVTNVQLGLQYFRQQLDRFGTIDKALSAYNGGYVNGTITNPTYVNEVKRRADYFTAKWATAIPGFPVEDTAGPTGGSGNGSATVAIVALAIASSLLASRKLLT